ncbi:MAG TPA: lysozyme inhibitor LprI family protein [Thermoanaerobaculia bacterium]|nr:lysozyme inhibitor LprI family protein [Thermoanaerobaculia bacterium]
MTHNRLPIVLAILMAATAIYGQDEQNQPAPKHPIDVAMDKCLEANHATMPRAKCYSTASESWQAAVKTSYAELLTLLPASGRPALRKSQAAWKQYEAGEAEVIMTMYGKKTGTGYVSVRITLLMKAYRDRALELQSHVQHYTPESETTE